MSQLIGPEKAIRIIGRKLIARGTPTTIDPRLFVMAEIGRALVEAADEIEALMVKEAKGLAK